MHDGARIDPKAIPPRGRARRADAVRGATDLSKCLLSSMPGLLFNVAVELGQKA